MPTAAAAQASAPTEALFLLWDLVLCLFLRMLWCLQLRLLLLLLLCLLLCQSLCLQLLLSLRLLLRLLLCQLPCLLLRLPAAFAAAVPAALVPKPDMEQRVQQGDGQWWLSAAAHSQL